MCEAETECSKMTEISFKLDIWFCFFLVKYKVIKELGEKNEAHSYKPNEVANAE